MLQLYKNIKNKRTELNMTQSELAKKLGYADKSMIAKIEKGLVDLTQSKIVAFADALNTTPGELMGWIITDDDIGNVFTNADLEEIIDNAREFSPTEKAHFKNYLHLLEINRKKVDKFTKKLLSLQQMEFELDAASKRTDIEISPNSDTSDNDIMDDENF